LSGAKMKPFVLHRGEIAIVLDRHLSPAFNFD
jgi:hypothetical protein